MPERVGPQCAAERGVVAHLLCDDVERTRDGLLLGFNLVGEIAGGSEVAALQNLLCEGGKAAFARLARAGGPLLFEGAVEVLHLGERRGGVHRGAELGREPARLLDQAKHVLLAGLERFEIGEPLAEGAQRLVVRSTGALLAIAGDEGEGVALV